MQEIRAKSTANDVHDRIILSSERTHIGGLSVFGYSSGVKTPFPIIEHQHKDKVEFVILIKGLQEYIASGVRYTLYPGDVFFTSQGEMHSCVEMKDTKNEILWFQLDISPLTNLFDLPEIQAQVLRRELSNHVARRAQLEQQLMLKFMESFDLLCTDSPCDRIKGRSLLLYSLMSMLKLQAESKTLTHEISAAKQYIYDHIYEHIGIEELTMASSLPTVELKSQFREQLGVSPREYIGQAKIEAAKRVVALTKKSIVDIAFAFNFSSSKYFCLLFKKQTGLTPRAFRKKYAQGKIEL